ncbi:hypothetical protein JCM6882_005558 [Rhodosporidiobolus microsporus]
MQYSRSSRYNPHSPPPPQRYVERRWDAGGGGTERREVDGRWEAPEGGGVGRGTKRSREEDSPKWQYEGPYHSPRKSFPVQYVAQQPRSDGRHLPSALPPKPSFLPPRPPTEICLAPPPPKRTARFQPAPSSPTSLSSRSFQHKPAASMGLPKQARERSERRPSQVAHPLDARFQPGPYARQQPLPKQPPSFSSYPSVLQPPPSERLSLDLFPLAGGATRKRFYPSNPPPPPSTTRDPYIPPSAVEPQPVHKVYKLPAPTAPPPPTQPASHRFPSSSHSSTSPSSLLSSVSPSSSRLGPSPSVKAQTTATPPPAKLAPGDPNPPWLERELWGPAYGTWEKGWNGEREGKGKGKKRARGEHEEGEEEGDVVGDGLDWNDWEKRERRKKRKRARR